MASDTEGVGVSGDPRGAVVRREALRRRVYLTCLIVGIPSMLAVCVARSGDPYVAIAYPLYTASLGVVLLGLLRGRMSVGAAERVVLVGTTVTFLTGFVVELATTPDLAALREVTNVSAMLTVNLMAMLAYVALETRTALRFSLGVVGVTAVSILGRLVPEAVAGQLGSEAADYVSMVVFLGTAVGLLHIVAQVKEHAAEARAQASTLRALVNTDPLTGIANRRHLHDTLEAELRELSERAPLTVILADLDHFKQINDAHGHDVGDEVLRRASTALADMVGSRGLVGRWGGEEFLILAPGLTAAEAHRLAEECRIVLSSVALPVGGTVTASLGLAVVQAGEDARTLLRRADEALYAAKAAGRDRVQPWTARIPALPSTARA